MRIITLSILLIVLAHAVNGQYFQFSQYNFSAQRVNPASIGTDDYAKASLLYRNQATAGGFNLSSSLFNVSYPLMSRGKGRWAGVGLSFLDDRAGTAGLYTNQEVSASFAVHIPIARYQTVSFGANGLHSRRQLDLSGLTTGSQYIEGRGLDPAFENGEPLSGLQNKYFTFSTGIYWEQTDNEGARIASFGFSFFDINRPDESFLDQRSPHASTFVISASAMVAENDNVRLFPEVLYTRNAGRNVLNAGFVTSYVLNRYKDKPSDRVDLLTKYVIGRSGIVGIQFHKENLSLGLSYDFPVLRDNVANTGAIELGLELRKILDPKWKKRKRKATTKQATSRKTPTSATNRNASNTKTPVARKDTVSRAGNSVRNDMSARLKQKQDSVQALARTGNFQHEQLVLEETTLRFGFDFNRSELEQSSKDFLDELAVALSDNDQLKVELTGHTDNVGSAKFNQRLSLERANSIRSELVERGVSPDRITVKGKGLTEPLNANATPEQRAENRRVEMKIYYED